MKIKTVGTGAITGAYRSACTLVDDKILIDCGNGIIKTLEEQGVSPNNIEIVLITHLHADHFFDLPFFLLTKSLYKSQTKTKIYCPRGTEKIIEHLCNDYIANEPGAFNEWKNDGNIEFIEFDNLEEQEVLDNYFVSAYPTKHANLKQSYGYVIKKDNKSVGFSGDSVYCENINKIVENSNISVLDMTFINSSKTHMGVEDIEILAKKYNKPIITTHMTKEARDYAKSKNIENLIIPTDGQEIEI